MDVPAEAPREFVRIATAMVARLEIPDSPTRKIFLALAEILDDPRTSGIDVAVAVGGFHEMSTTMRDAYKRRSPLEEQAEFLRLRGELKEATGYEAPDPYKLD